MTQAAVKEAITKNELGYTTAIQYKDFWAYIEKKKMTRHDILKLKSEKREDFFMKWKHGMSDMNTNWEFEYSLRAFLRNFKELDLNDIDPYFKNSVKIRREFDSYCDSIKHQIGLWTGHKDSGNTPELPDEIKQLAASVGGTVIDVGSQNGGSI